MMVWTVLLTGCSVSFKPQCEPPHNSCQLAAALCVAQRDHRVTVCGKGCEFQIWVMQSEHQAACCVIHRLDFRV